MSEERNTLAWPSIEQLPREIASRINRFLAVSDVAATTIQRAHRRQAQLGQADYRGGYRSRLHRWLLEEPVETSEKYDGTNVGKLRDGKLLGRRLVIDAAATSYQRCELGKLRSLGTDQMLDEVVAIGGSLTVRRAALYGELLCNAGLYSYATSGVAKSWQAFGALIEFADASGASATRYAKAATALGLITNRCDETTVRVCNSRTFGEIAQRHDVPVVPTTHHLSMSAALSRNAEWMVGEHGEGLVLSVASGESRASLFKWKISREPQPVAVDSLTGLIEALGRGADGKACLLDAQIHRMVRQLHTVATHKDSTVAKAAASSSAKQPKPAKPAAVNAEAVSTAIASALTKFDAFEAYFDTHGQPGVATLAERLTAEVLADTELPLPSEGDTAREAAVREVATAVKRTVGQAFGAWKKRTG